MVKVPKAYVQKFRSETLLQLCRFVLTEQDTPIKHANVWEIAAFLAQHSWASPTSGQSNVGSVRDVTMSGDLEEGNFVLSVSGGKKSVTITSTAPDKSNSKTLQNMTPLTLYDVQSYFKDVNGVTKEWIKEKYHQGKFNMANVDKLVYNINIDWLALKVPTAEYYL